MRRKEFMNVNEERLKEIMAHETDADGCPKTHPDGIEKEENRGKEETESVSIPDGRTEKPTVFHKPAVRSGTSLAERMKTYRADYLSRREYVHRKQTYISYETYRRLARILPLLSEGMTVPAFLDNVLNRHLDEHGDVLDEMVTSMGVFAIMNCTLFRSTFACCMSLCTMNPAENLAHLLSFHTMNPSSSVVRQIYQSPVSSSCAKLTRPPPRIPSSIDMVFDR